MAWQVWSCLFSLHSSGDAGHSFQTARCGCGRYVVFILPAHPAGQASLLRRLLRELHTAARGHESAPNSMCPRTPLPSHHVPSPRAAWTLPRRSSANSYIHDDLLPISAAQVTRQRRGETTPQDEQGTSERARVKTTHTSAARRQAEAENNVGSTGRAPGGADDADDVRVGGRRGEPHAHGPAVAGGPGRHPDREGAGQGRRRRGPWSGPPHLRRQEGAPRRQRRCRGNRHRRHCRVIVLGDGDGLCAAPYVCVLLCALLGCSVYARVDCEANQPVVV